MIKQEAHDPKDFLVVRSEEEVEDDDRDEEEGVVSLPSESDSVIHEKGHRQTASFQRQLFLSCCSCNISMVRKVLNPYIIHFERYKKEKLEKIKRV
jgi:hypothetical protein